MELLTDVAFLSRLQFALTVIFHFLFVPLSIGLGLFAALAETRYYKTRDPKDKAASRFWVKVFTTTFIIGVATGITMEFSFGTNWANYSRFVGDIFGAPLAAEALLAFFLESVFLGVVLFAREKISPKLYLVSTWLVWFGSALSALWILIANSWMQTPAGYEVLPDGSKAVITDFWAAALNPSTVPRYLHTVDSLLILGSFVVMAVGAYYILRKRTPDQIAHGKVFLKRGLIVGIITVILMLPFAHMQAAQVAETQPAKLAAMEGQWEDGPVGFAITGIVDDKAEKSTLLELPIPGFTSFLATGSFDTVYPGLNTMKDGPVDLSGYEGVKVDSYEGGIPGVNITFQSYHIMVLLYGVMIIWLILAGVLLKKSNNASDGAPKGKLLPYLIVFGPLIPFICIQAGWMVTEIGRQPWVVYNLLLTNDAISMGVSAVEILITIALFIVFYVVLFIAWLRIVLKQIKTGPVVDGDDAVKASVLSDSTPAAVAVGASATECSGDAAVSEDKDQKDGE
ncbi:MAG: cytochrome ubiquinol oxidase subunit I [Coriobacteriales bacterium]|jgi:cytochrome d ubiquinol oxidase subunit I|nr:cytochrome ubiquinol oxidase subunit I [Coriobacteriales bacterium]